MTYPGGKNGSGVPQRIINLIPPHRVYVEGCAGSAAILRQKRPAEISYAIDVDSAVIGKLADAGPPGTTLIQADVIEWLEGYSFDGREFVYLDPPYLRSTRRGKARIYRYEFSVRQHRRLLAIAKRLPCPVMISGYYSPLYASQLAEWRSEHFRVMTRGGPAEEWLWMNYSRPTRLHDDRYLGGTFRVRQDWNRKRQRWRRKFAALPRLEQVAILEALQSAYVDPHGSSADDGHGGERRSTNGESAGAQVSIGESAVGRPSASPPIPPGGVTTRRELVLSLFPGVDLLGRAFRESGFCVVTGPDLITGGDIRDFVGTAGRFDGVIGGSPCQDFSSARRTPRTGNGVSMIREFLRVVGECRPTWFLLENVPRVPDARLDGYQVQRIDLTDAECGGAQLRRRHFQFGHREGWILRPDRLQLSHASELEPAATTRPSHGKPTRTFAELCRLQGLAEPLDLPGWSREAKFRAVGNGVPMAMGRTLARAVLSAGPRDYAADCVCGCGRSTAGQARHAGAGCRKRMERRRRTPRPVVEP